MAVDYAFGKALVRDTSDVVASMGGKVLGTSLHPFGAPDFSSNLLQAQSSRAKMVAFANGGNDLITAVKQSAEFRVTDSGQRIAALLAFLSDVKSMGLESAQGLNLTAAFYWDQNDETRAWSQRFYERNKVMPTMTQAGTYGAVMHYLNAVKAVGGKDADKVMAQMRETPINDFMTTNGKLRIDGRVIRDMHLYEVKKPEESSGEWDLYKVVSTIPGEEAFMSLEKGGCHLAQN